MPNVCTSSSFEMCPSKQQHNSKKKSSLGDANISIIEKQTREIACSPLNHLNFIQLYYYYYSTCSFSLFYKIMSLDKQKVYALAEWFEDDF